MINFIDMLSLFHSFNMILVITDRLMDYIKLEPTYFTATSEDIIYLVYKL